MYLIDEFVSDVVSPDIIVERAFGGAIKYGVIVSGPCPTVL